MREHLVVPGGGGADMDAGWPERVASDWDNAAVPGPGPGPG